MQTYEISINGRRLHIVKASAPDVAIKRLLGGGQAAGFKFATVGPGRAKLRKGEGFTIAIKRIA